MFPFSGLVRKTVSAAFKPFRTVPFSACARKGEVMAEKKNGDGLLCSSERQGRTVRGDAGNRAARRPRAEAAYGLGRFSRLGSVSSGGACRIALCRVRFPLRVTFRDFGNDNGWMGEGGSEREAPCRRREQPEVQVFKAARTGAIGAITNAMSRAEIQSP